MIDFNYASLDVLLGSNFYHYDVEEMIELMERYFYDKIKLEPRINGAKKDALMYDILDTFKNMNEICIKELNIEPFIPEPINKNDIPNLVYNFFEYKMDFNNPNSKYMTKPHLSFGYDNQYFNGNMVCYICPNCGKNMEYAVEIVNREKEEKGHIGMECKECNNTVFPIFIRDTDRKVIMKD